MSRADRSGGFVKLQDPDKRDEGYDTIIETLFNENGLYRKRLPKGPRSLGRAISDALFFTPNKQEEIQQDLLKHLTQLVASNSLTARLHGFHNSMMLNDFANNPQLPGFEKTTLELVSLLYKVKVVLYTMNEDHYLSSLIFNNNFTKTVEILRTKANHYEAVFAKTQIDKATHCQNIVLNIIDKIGSKSPSKALKNLNSDKFLNFSFETAQSSADNNDFRITRGAHKKSLSDNYNTNFEAMEEQQNKFFENFMKSSFPPIEEFPGTSPKENDQFRITRGAHKKSLSDNFNTNFEAMEEQQNKIYESFMNAGFVTHAQEDIFKNVTLRKDTAESGFSINANFDFIDEQNFDGPYPQEFAMKNYPMPKGRISPRNLAGSDVSPTPNFSKAKFSSHANVHFNENLSFAEMDRIVSSVNTATTQDSKQLGVSSPFYSPPGLSPSKYPQRNFSDTTSQSDFLGISPMGARDAKSPTYQFGKNSPSKGGLSPFAQSYNGMPEPSFGGNITPFAPQGQPFHLQTQQFNPMYMKRMNVGNSMGMQGQDDYMGYDQEGFDMNGELDSPNTGPREKKKPIILDESKERFNGRLKFFDENKKYGFIVMDEDGSDIFVHYDDLCKANVTKEMLRTVRNGNVLRFNFGLMDYIGKYNRSRKAIDIQFEGM